MGEQLVGTQRVVRCQILTCKRELLIYVSCSGGGGGEESKKNPGSLDTTTQCVPSAAGTPALHANGTTNVSQHQTAPLHAVLLQEEHKPASDSSLLSRYSGVLTGLLFSLTAVGCLISLWDCCCFLLGPRRLFLDRHADVTQVNRQPTGKTM